MQTSMLTAANRGVGRYGWLLGLGLGALAATLDASGVKRASSLPATRFRLRTFASARMTSTERYLATKPRLRCPLALPIGAVRPK